MKVSFVSVVTLLVLSILYFLENFDKYLIAVAIIPYIDYSSYEYSVLVGPAFTIIYAVGGLFFSLVRPDEGSTHYFSMNNILFASTLFFSIGFGATALCVNFWQQVLVRLVMGLAQSVITPFSASVIRESFPSEYCGTAFSVFNTGTYVAFSLSLSLGVYIYDAYGWKAGYLLFGLIGISCSFLVPCLSCFQAHNKATLTSSSSSQSPLSTHHKSSDDDSSLAQLQQSQQRGPMRADNPLIVEDPDSLHGQSQQVANKSSSSAVSSSSASISASSTSLMPSIDRKSEEEQTLRGYLQQLDQRPRSLRTTASSCTLYLRQIKQRLREIIVDYWWREPGILLLCLATSLRLGAGYIWSSYTAIFFSDLFLYQEQSIDCDLSYSSSGSSSSFSSSTAAVCPSSSYPYSTLEDHTCSALNPHPWHNQGMDPLHLEEYMSWVPLVGSALGNLLGGILSDYLIGSSSSNNEEDREMMGPGHSQDHVLYRALIAGLSTWLSLPMVILSFYLSFPGCFLIYIASGMVGEIYLSQTLALITEKRFIPSSLLSASVALFVLLSTAIAGNATLIVPFLQTYTYQGDVTLSFQAMSEQIPGQAVDYQVTQANAVQLQGSIMYALIGCYGLSGGIYILAYGQLVRTLNSRQQGQQQKNQQLESREVI